MIKIVILVFIYTAIFVHDFPKLKEYTGKTFLVYTALIIVSLYLSMMYAFDLEWPFLHTAFDALLGDQSRRIVEFLKVPTS